MGENKKNKEEKVSKSKFERNQTIINTVMAVAIISTLIVQVFDIHIGPKPDTEVIIIDVDRINSTHELFKIVISNLGKNEATNVTARIEFSSNMTIVRHEIPYGNYAITEDTSHIIGVRWNYLPPGNLTQYKIRLWLTGDDLTENKPDVEVGPVSIIIWSKEEGTIHKVEN
jgi:type II secretory ATPase GspE/PulE/Tfp pilus assembly ATPase PilB-like protein